MSQVRDFDVVILGGGMTGLTLAHHIATLNAAQPANQRQTLVIEPRKAYLRDKTWCYWQHAKTPFDAAITHQWSQWSVSWDNKTQVSRANIPYVRVDSSRFYDIARREIDASESVTLQLGEKAKSVISGRAKVEITSQSNVWRANTVFDTRPAPLPEDILLQHFVGWELSLIHI